MAQSHRHSRIAAAALAALAVLAGATGCGSAAPPSYEREGDLGGVLRREFPYCAEMWKASSNGICQNGLSLAGLTETGLGLEALASQSFSAWFDQDPIANGVLMRYLVKCAAPSAEVVEWTSPTSGIAYLWPGGLAVATGWASGQPMTGAEQQLLSACLAAHVNKFGLTVPLAVEGRVATGEEIALDPGELETFSVREACFFGDLFAGEGVMVGLDHDPYDASTSSARACAFDVQPESTVSEACPPMLYVGSCQAACVPAASGVYYESCTWGGKAYLPVTTRLRPEEIYTCGDGVCQFTEWCGTGVTVDDCALDCGACL